MAPAIGFLSETEGKSLLLNTLHTQIIGLGLLGVHPVVKENNRRVAKERKHLIVLPSIARYPRRHRKWYSYISANQ